MGKAGGARGHAGGEKPVRNFLTTRRSSPGCSSNDDEGSSSPPRHAQPGAKAKKIPLKSISFVGSRSNSRGSSESASPARQSAQLGSTPGLQQLIRIVAKKDHAKQPPPPDESHQPRVAIVKAKKIRGMSSGSPTPSPSPDARSPRSGNPSQHNAQQPIQRLVIKRAPAPQTHPFKLGQEARRGSPDPTGGSAAASGGKESGGKRGSGRPKLASDFIRSMINIPKQSASLFD